MSVDLLAIAAHRDDVELTCAGTLIKAAKQGHTTAVIDLTAGEMGTKGDAKSRADDATARAGKPVAPRRRDRQRSTDAHVGRSRDPPIQAAYRDRTRETGAP